MNKDRRKRLQEVRDALEGQLATLEEIRDEEQESYDNYPESLQESERGQALYQNVESLESAYNDLESLMEGIQEVLER